MPHLMHVISLQQTAGVETHFGELAARALVRRPDWAQGWMNPAGTMHPFFRKRLEPVLSHTVHAKYRWGLKMPPRPVWLRTWHHRRSIADTRPDVLLIWNRMVKLNSLIDAVGEDRCIHWEQGAAWEHGKEEVDRARYLRRIPRVMASSTACARFLQIHWDYPGEIHVCRPALRPSLKPGARQRKSYPADGRLRLGVAAPLYPAKGIVLALHALARLRARGVDAELAVAGTGPEQAGLSRLAAALGVHEHVHFRRAVWDMRSFYQSIHCLLHPALTEASGLVAIEAAAYGAPVIAAAVDGLPEELEDEVTGFMIEPTLPVQDYAALGGGVGGVPPLVYYPRLDRLKRPRLVDPSDLATAVERLFASADAYERFSAAASDHVRGDHAFDAHVDEVMGIVEGGAVGHRPLLRSAGH